MEASGEHELPFPILTTQESVSPKQEFGEQPAHEHKFCCITACSSHGGGNFLPGRKAVESPGLLLASAAGRGWGLGKDKCESRRKCGAANMHPITKQPEDARIQKWDTLLFHKLS